MASFNTTASTTQNTNDYKRPAREPQQIIFSICIPRVFKNISERRIRAIFYSLRLGFVERVDMVAKTSQKGDEFWRVFVHFSKWYQNKDAVNMREKLESGDKVKIVYDNPWYWLINKSTSKRPEEKNADTSHNKRPKPFIDFGHSVPKAASKKAVNFQINQPDGHLNEKTFPPLQGIVCVRPERSNADEANSDTDESNANTDVGIWADETVSDEDE